MVFTRKHGDFHGLCSFREGIFSVHIPSFVILSTEILLTIRFLLGGVASQSEKVTNERSCQDLLIWNMATTSRRIRRVSLPFSSDHQDYHGKNGFSSNQLEHIELSWSIFLVPVNKLTKSKPFVQHEPRDVLLFKL